MVGPAATAQRLVSGVGAGVLLSALLALAEAWGGLTLAFYTGLADELLDNGALYPYLCPGCGAAPDRSLAHGLIWHAT